MGTVKQWGQKVSRKSLKASASLFGLAAGAVGWSGLAQAAGEETGSQMMLLPEHYELMETGVVVFKLETGENLSLTSNQYLILEDGLLLITDELAQASIYSLPVMGSVRAQLLSDLEQVATIDGTAAEVTPAQTLSITEGQAPRLSEQVELQSYEVAQSSGDDTNDVGDALATSMAVAPGAMALLGGLMTSDQPEAETPAPPAGPEFWTDADVADSASTAITGSSANSFIGYTAASTTASTDPLTFVGRGVGSVATFDMSAGGNNYFVAGDGAAKASGSLTYTGGSGADSLTFGNTLAQIGSATFDMSAGGTNTLIAGANAGTSSGSISYTGGSGNDSLTFGAYLAYSGTATFDMSAGGNNTLVAGDPNLTAASWSNVGSSGSISYTGGDGDDSITINGGGFGYDGDVTIDMSAGGNNTLVAGDSAASANSSFVYTGGSGTDSLTFADDFAYDGTAVLDMSAGGNNSFIAGDDVAYNGSFTYTGGVGADMLTLGPDAAENSGSIQIDLGADTAADKITFQGSVGVNGGSVVIQNFDATSPTGDTIRLEGIALTSQLSKTSSPGGVTISSTGGAATYVELVLTANTLAEIDLTVVSGAVEIG